MIILEDMFMDKKDADTLVIVLINIYDNINVILNSRGYVENEDFADGRLLVPSKAGCRPWHEFGVLKDL